MEKITGNGFWQFFSQPNFCLKRDIFSGKYCNKPVKIPSIKLQHTLAFRVVLRKFPQWERVIFSGRTFTPLLIAQPSKKYFFGASFGVVRKKRFYADHNGLKRMILREKIQYNFFYVSEHSSSFAPLIPI